MFIVKADKKEALNKTIRFPLDLYNQIKEIAKDNNVSFSAIVIQACRYAIEHIGKDDDKKKNIKC